MTICYYNIINIVCHAVALLYDFPHLRPEPPPINLFF